LAIGVMIVAVFVLIAVLAPLLAPYDPNRIMVAPRLAPPSAAHPFGADALGRDLFSRVLFGARIALLMAVVGTAISASIGVSLGLLAGFRGGRTDAAVSRGMDVWLAFPGLLLAIVLVARLGPSLNNAIIALGIVGAPAFYRLSRTLTLSARETPYVESARAVGAPEGRIVLRHILPNIFGALLVMMTLRAGIVILAGGGLSFIGLGAQPPQPEWGALLAVGRDHMQTAPWLAWFPGLSITLVVLGLNLFGDGLRDLLDMRRLNDSRYD
jgi:ABC-type dipeptide/oligopeptide/nickel transport system permease subunit